MTTVAETQETEKSTITIKLTRSVNDKVVGDYRVSVGREVYEKWDVTIVSKVNGQKIWSWDNDRSELFKTANRFLKLPTGAHARVGDAYVGKKIYDIALAMMDRLEKRLPKSSEQVAIEQAQADAKAAANAWLDSDEYKEMVEFNKKMNAANSDY